MTKNVQEKNILKQNGFFLLNRISKVVLLFFFIICLQPMTKYGLFHLELIAGKSKVQPKSLLK